VRLICWLGRLDCPPAIKQCKLLFDKAYAPWQDDHVNSGDHSGDRLQSSSSCPSTVPADLHHLVKQSKVVLHAWLVRDQVVYARSSTHLGNSLVILFGKLIACIHPCVDSAKGLDMLRM